MIDNSKGCGWQCKKKAAMLCIVVFVLMIILISMLACASSGIDPFHPPTWFK